MIYLDIVVNIPLNQTFTYSFSENQKIQEKTADETLQTELFTKKKRTIKKTEEIILTPEIGKRAEIKFGNRRTTGYIVGIHKTIPEGCPVEEGKIRPVLKILDKVQNISWAFKPCNEIFQVNALCTINITDFTFPF